MRQLALAIGEIALRRRGPESLPDSSFLVGLLLGISVLMSILALILYDRLTLLRLEDFAVQVVLIFGFVFAALRFFKLERRYRQTMSAILGISILFLMIRIPFALGALVFDVDLTESRVYLAVDLALFLWSVVIEASIFARALSQPLLLGFMVEILYVLTSLSISRYFTPAVQ